MTNSDAAIHDYGHWPSPLSAEQLFARSETLSHLRPGRQGLFVVLGLPDENNAQALMYLDASGKRTRVSPAGMNLRSQVHEYGGFPYTVGTDTVYYCNLDDQRIYRQPFDESTVTAGLPEALTPVDAARPKVLRYAELLFDARRQRLICVREDHRHEQKEAINALVSIALDAPGEGDILYADSDFVAAPALSSDGQLLAFQTWSHPNMPWDNTEVRVGQVDATGQLLALRIICADRGGSQVMPSFGPRDDLYFIADWNDWWNLYCIAAKDLDSAAASSGDCAVPVMPVDAECCSSQFVLGQHSYDFAADDTLLIGYVRDCAWTLASVHRPTGKKTVLLDRLGTLEHLYYWQGKAVCLAATAFDPVAVVSVDLQNRVPRQVLYQGRSGAELPATMVSAPQHLTFYAGTDRAAHALYYPPVNSACRAPEHSLPPVLVSVHGGPTGSARAAFNPAVQFWTTRGFGYLDVNYRGSTGYGRRFRHSLYKLWGIADIEDVIHAVQQLVDSGRADPQRLVIRGSSAGGYAVLAALAASDVFAAGVSYYGICDLELLARDTHKFESRYLDQLIGPYPEQAALYRARSPLHQIDRIEAPVLLLQGKLDKVVPPNQAEMIFRLLREKHPATRCVYFDDEGHGFRKPRNQLAALQSEMAFYNVLLL